MGELESIQVFLAIVEQGSFAGAARQLGLTPASVTRTIAALEGRLGVQLLVRTTRQLSLTSAGAIYAARVGPLARGLADAASELREAQGQVSGLLRISAPIALGRVLLPEVLARFAALHPDAQVVLDLSDRFVDILDEEHDLAIRISGPPEGSSTIWRKISQVPRVLVASPAYLQGHGVPRLPGDLAAHACLAHGTDARGELWELERAGHRHAHVAQGRLSANNADLLARLALGGQGIARLPRFIIAQDLARGDLVETLGDWASPPIWLTLYYPPYDRLPLKVKAFSDLFETHVHAVGLG